MPSPLEAIVQGLQENREHKEKQAREVAQQQAVAYERQFKAEQAKRDAEYTQQEINIRKQQAQTAEARQRVEDARQKALEEHQKRQDETAKARNEIQAQISLGKLDLSDHKATNEQYLKLKAAYLKEGRPPEEATALAMQDMADMAKAQTQPNPLLQGLSGLLQQSQGAPQNPGAVPPSGNPIMDMLKQRQYHGIQAPAERPPNTLGPMIAADLAKKQAETQAIAALEEQRRTQAKVNETMVEVNKAYKQSLVGVNEARKQEIEKKISLMDVESAAKVAELNAMAAAANQRVADSIKDIKLRRDKFEFEKTKAALKDKATRDDASGKLTSELLKLQDEKRKLFGDMKEVEEGVAQSNLLLQRGYLESQVNKDTGQKYTKEEADRLRAMSEPIAAEQLRRRNEIAFMQRSTDEQLLNINAALQNGSVSIKTTPNGAPVPKATQKSAEASKRAAEAIGGLPGLPHSPHVPYIPPGVDGAQVGQYARQPPPSPFSPPGTAHREGGSAAKRPAAPKTDLRKKVPIRKGEKGKTKRGKAFEIIGVKE